MLKKIKSLIKAITLTPVFPVMSMPEASSSTGAPEPSPPGQSQEHPEPSPHCQENPSGSLPTPNSQLPTGDDRISLLEGMLANRGEEIKKVLIRAEETEKALTGANTRIAELERAAAASNENAGKLDQSYKKAVSSYRTLISQANPGILPELISGDTIEAVDDSLVKARELIGKVRKNLEEQTTATRIPAGAPQRGRPDSGSLSSWEKIARGIEK